MALYNLTKQKQVNMLVVASHKRRYSYVESQSAQHYAHYRFDAGRCGQSVILIDRDGRVAVSTSLTPKGRIQFSLGTLPGSPPATLAEVLQINQSAQSMLDTVFRQEMMLDSKLRTASNIPTELDQLDRLDRLLVE